MAKTYVSPQAISFFKVLANGDQMTRKFLEIISKESDVKLATVILGKIEKAGGVTPRVPSQVLDLFGDIYMSSETKKLFRTVYKELEKIDIYLLANWLATFGAKEIL